jgi:hypothetical protein
MAGELGLLNSYREKIYFPMQNWANPSDDRESKRNCDLESFCQAKGLKNTAGKPITEDDIWNDLGIDKRRITMNNLLTLSDDIKYFVPEIVRGFINKGLRAKPFWDQLCAGQVDVNGQQSISPWVVYDNEGMEVTGEAETVAEASLEWGYKLITLQKRAKRITYSDEVMYGCVLPQIGPFLERIGVQLSASMNRAAITTLIAGDIPTGDECAVIGTTTGNSLTFPDFSRAWTRGDLLVYDWESMISGEAVTNTIKGISEFTRPQGYGKELVRLQEIEPLFPEKIQHFTSSAMPDGQVMLLDRESALLHLTFLPLRLENERIINRMLNATQVSLIDGFSTIDRRARVIIDSSKQWSAGGQYDFPGWMKPLN